MHGLIVVGGVLCALGVGMLLRAFRVPAARPVGLVVEHRQTSVRRWPHPGMTVLSFCVCTTGFAMIFYVVQSS